MTNPSLRMQLVRICIDGVQYELFGPVILEEDGELGKIEALVFSEIVPAKAVLAYLTDIVKETSEEDRKKMQ